ncbi:alanine racemase [Microbacterium sp. BWT-B31]|uniref:alanine racemase n=1 Tax=Microbacterium sp. BWT-B31 TaxID=3232072 RepID=UPI0035295C3F
MSRGILTVDLDVFAANLHAARTRIAPAELMFVVKDDAYAHGLPPLVTRAWAEGVRWFGALDVPTGRAVRAAIGAEARVFVWLAFGAQDLGDVVDFDFDLGVGDAALLEEIAARAGERPVRVHLKIDSGLHRNGVRPEEWGAFVTRAAELESAGAIEVVGIWSHIAEASDEEDDAARAAFDRAVAEAEAAGLRPRLRHLAASAASFERAEFRYDMCRIGAFCYGIRPAGGPGDDALGIRPIATLSVPVVGVEPDAVVLGIGALDGLPSTLAGRFTVATPEGERRVLRIDDRQSRVEPWADAAAGEWVAVHGGNAHSSATDLAEQIGTIGEEIALRVSPTVRRVYVGG